MQLIEEDVAYQGRARYTKVVDWDVLSSQVPSQLKVSLIAVILQLNRRG